MITVVVWNTVLRVLKCGNRYRAKVPSFYQPTDVRDLEPCYENPGLTQASLPRSKPRDAALSLRGIVYDSVPGEYARHVLSRVSFIFYLA
jgi:hypothetical protein